jgi:broad specificity phosphatase PhoE
VGVYPAWYGDDDRFPGGESIKDLGERAKSALEKLVLPYVWQAAKEGTTGNRIAVVSHGLCIGEMISELLKRSAEQGRKFESHLKNSAWTRVVIDIEVVS